MDQAVTAAIELLSHPLSAKRRSGAKRLRKLAAREAGPPLLRALEEEGKDSRTWESQYLLILAIGVCRYTDALSFLRRMSEQEHAATILYYGLGDAIFRLLLDLNGVAPAIDEICRTDGFDALPALAQAARHQMMDGAFHVVAIQKLVPSDATIRLMIARARDPRATQDVVRHPGDTTGIRKWVAAAAAGWKSELVDDFLRECQTNGDHLLMLAAEKSLKREYVNWGAPY